MTAAIPPGFYCYTSLGPMDSRGHMKINGMCPHWERRSEGHAFCRFLGKEDDLGLLADQVKICGVNDEWPAQRIEARSDETRNAAQPGGREPDGEADAPK